MNYEEKYKEALKAVKELREANPSDDGIQNWVNEKFPELFKDEDEKIRKEIKQLIQGMHDADPRKERWLTWLEKQDNESVNIDIESMVSSYEQRLLSQSNGVRNSPLVNMCLTAFRRGIENTLEELNLKKLEKQGGQKLQGKTALETINEEKIDNANYVKSADKVKPKIAKIVLYVY